MKTCGGLLQTGGFTLVELLVVIAIVAMLVSILLPVLGLACEQARQLVCVANQRALTAGWYLYQDDNAWEIETTVKQYAELRDPADKYVFVVESDGRGFNLGSWVLAPVTGTWIDPVAIWHHDRSTIGFADGHAEMKIWEDERTIEMSLYQAFYQDHADSPDFGFMLRGYPYVKLTGPVATP